MQRDKKAYLWDILNSIDLIQRFIGKRNLVDYSNDAMLRSAVERQLEIVGEALAQLVRRFPGQDHALAGIPRSLPFAIA